MIEDHELQQHAVLQPSPWKTWFVSSRRGHKVHRLREVLANGAARTACSNVLPQGGEFVDGWYVIGYADGPNMERLHLPIPQEPLRRPFELCQICLEHGAHDGQGDENVPMLTQVERDRLQREMADRATLLG